MSYLMIIIQLIISVAIINVWLFRFRQSSPWRAGNASNMEEEFATYGLPKWSLFVVGFLKITLAIVLLLSLWHPVLRTPSAVGIATLMVGAVAMHVKVGDPLKKSVPAFSLFILSLLVVLVQQN